MKILIYCINLCAYCLWLVALFTLLHCQFIYERRSPLIDNLQEIEGKHFDMQLQTIKNER